ncbi:MAG: hypothetical protein H6813_05630 [Phycisphaeraceae bacterium]|nr:hypothetical protein [Phycisphaeraceae bacterium]MCB9847948.1 hypothetical protein [Phycisphaeraceae bacterium]
MSMIHDDPGAKPMSGMVGGAMDDTPEHDSAAAVAIELLGGATIDQAVPERKKPIPDSALLLALVVLVAGGGLYLMRQMGLGAKIQFTNVKIDYPLEGGSQKGDDQRLLADLRSGGVEQVPLNQVQKNPFELIGEARMVNDMPVLPRGESPEEARLRRAAEDRQRLIANRYASLDLNSVLLGGVPVARISGQTVRVGDLVADLFLVKSITSRTVDLEVDGKLYTLSLGE